MLRLCLLAGLLGLVSAQSNSVLNDWYSASMASGTSIATSSPTSPTPSIPSLAISSVVTPPTLSTLSSTESLLAMSSKTASSSGASSSGGAALRAVASIVSFPVGGNSSVKGTVTFQQADANSATIITYDLTGNDPNMQRGIHIHRDSNTDCNAAGPHFDPMGTGPGHGLLNDPISHVGDLGNIATDSSGNAKGSLSATRVTLFGPDSGSVIGRTFVVHGGEDDGGKTNMGTSSTTGNSGLRVACGIIILST